MPDLVGNLRVDQAWGSAQIMGALHQVAALYYGTTEGTGHPSDKLGFAVGAGIKLKADVISKGDYFEAEVDYTQGASRYLNNTALVWNYVKYDGNTIGYGFNADAVFGAGWRHRQRLAADDSVERERGLYALLGSGLEEHAVGCLHGGELQ